MKNKIFASVALVLVGSLLLPVAALAQTEAQVKQSLRLQLAQALGGLASVIGRVQVQLIADASRAQVMRSQLVSISVPLINLKNSNLDTPEERSQAAAVLNSTQTVVSVMANEASSMANRRSQISLALGGLVSIFGQLNPLVVALR